MKKWLIGYVTCSVKGGSRERFMNLCRHHHIELWDIYERDSILYFNISIKDFKRLKPLAKKSLTLPHIEGKKGAPMVVKTGRRYWTFVVSAFTFFVILYALSCYVWTIEVIGQNAYTKEMIIESLSDFDVHIGMKRSRLECDKIETYLRKKYDNLSWVSAEEVGSRLRIKVKEGTPTIASEKKGKAHHLIADVKGKIASIVTGTGTPMVKKGDKVKKGDILISGLVELTDDSNTVIGYKAVPASGSVIVEATVPYQKKIPFTYNKKVYMDNTFSLYHIDFLGHTFSLKNPLKQFDKSRKYDIITKVCLDEPFEKFDFPLTVLKRECTPYEYQTATYTKEEAFQLCKKGYEKYLSELKKKNCEMIDNEGVFDKVKTGYLLKCKVRGLFTQTQKKGIQKEERRITTQNEKNN